MAELTRFSSDRAPRLRRIAQLIDDQAERARSPAKARAIACQLRLRAAALEAGSEAQQMLEQDSAELRGAVDEPGA